MFVAAGLLEIGLVLGLQGTSSSKKKKKNKLKRVVATVKKAARKDKLSKQESFAAVQLLHDPQVCLSPSTSYKMQASSIWVLSAQLANQL